MKRPPNGSLSPEDSKRPCTASDGTKVDLGSRKKDLAPGANKASANTPSIQAAKGTCINGGGDTTSAGGELEKECPCGAGMCLLLPSKVFKERKYYRCPKKDDERCDYFTWFGAELEPPVGFTCSKSDSNPLVSCLYPAQRLPKDHLFELFVSSSVIAKCTLLTTIISNQPVIATYMVPGAKEDDHRSYKKASTSTQEVVHLIVLFVSSLQESGWTLNGEFELSDFYVTPFGKLVMSEAKLSILDKASKIKNTKDFCQVHKIIVKDIFLVKSEDQLPIDFKIFVGFLNAFEEKNRYLVLNSTAFMTQEGQLRFVSKVFKKLTALEKTNLAKHNQILDQLPYIDPKVTEGEHMFWKLRADRYNKYLSYHLSYENDQKRSKEEKAQEPVEDNKKKDKLGKKYPDGGKGQVKLIRNCDEHLHEAHSLLKVRPGSLIVSFEKPGANDANSEYCDNSEPLQWTEGFDVEEVGYITDEAFPGAVIMIQKAMHDAGELNKAL
ncbi:hypothetical protein ACQ4PT_054024 [Festuca glaucescens]